MRYQVKGARCRHCNRQFISAKKCKTFTKCCSPECTRKHYKMLNNLWLKRNPAKRQLYNERRNAIYAKTRATVRGIYSHI